MTTMATMTEGEVARLSIAAMSTDQIAAELHQRVQALYRLNAELAAQCDRLGKVVEAARLWNSINHRDTEGVERALAILGDACDGYDAEIARVTKESSGGRDNG